MTRTHSARASTFASRRQRALRAVLCGVLWLCSASVATLACDGEPGDAGPDAGNPEPDAGNPDPDAAGPVVLMTNVADGADNISILTELRATSPAALDAATVDDTRVTLRDRYDNLMSAAVSYDPGAQALILQPAVPLAYDATYHFAVDDIVTAAGQAVQPVSLSFTTSAGNAWLRSTSYTDGDISSYVGPGGGRPDVSSIWYAGPGPDGAWYTDDDEISMYFKDVWPDTSTRHSLTYDDPGADGVWFTDDDVLASYRSYTEYQDEQWTVQMAYDDPGADGAWFTEDDNATRRITLQFEQDRLILLTVAREPGPDLVWGTADDLINLGDRRQYEDRRLVRSYTVTGAGADGTWGTDDDDVSSYLAFGYDERAELQISSRSYYAPGPDGAWDTADDLLGQLTEYSHDERKLRTDAVRYSAGPDMTWMTPDDVIVRREENSHDDMGNMLDYRVFGNPGPDGAWFTEDDVVWQHDEYEM